MKTVDGKHLADVVIDCLNRGDTGAAIRACDVALAELKGPSFVLVTLPAKGIRDGATWRETTPEQRSIIGPFSTWNAAQQWRDQRIHVDGATAEILTPETPR